ncbi:MAG: hypothetical protein AABX11_06365 [Nanoarchaeota archaeon]
MLEIVPTYYGITGPEVAKIQRTLSKLEPMLGISSRPSEKMKVDVYLNAGRTHIFPQENNLREIAFYVGGRTDGMDSLIVHSGTDYVKINMSSTSKSPYDNLVLFLEPKAVIEAKPQKLRK